MILVYTDMGFGGEEEFTETFFSYVLRDKLSVVLLQWTHISQWLTIWLAEQALKMFRKSLD